MRKFSLLALVLLLMALFSGCDALDKIIPKIQVPTDLQSFTITVPKDSGGGLYKTVVDATTSSKWTEYQAKMKDMTDFQVKGHFNYTSSDSISISFYVSNSENLTVDDVKNQSLLNDGTVFKLDDVTIPKSSDFSYESRLIAVPGALYNIISDGKFAIYAVCYHDDVEISFTSGQAIVYIKAI